MSNKKHNSKTCHKCQQKSTKCHTGVEMEVGYKPKVHAHQVYRKGTQFDVDVDVKTVPRCHIRQKKIHGNSCSFVVDVDVDFECKPKIKKLKPNPKAKFDLDVKVDTYKIKGGNKKQHHKNNK
jgi:hypothetical protein